MKCRVKQGLSQFFMATRSCFPYILTMQQSLTLDSALTSKGQVTLPVELRRALGLKAGDRIIYEPDGPRAYRIRKADKIDVAWSRSLESTLSEWQGNADDDL